MSSSPAPVRTTHRPAERGVLGAGAEPIVDLELQTTAELEHRLLQEHAHEAWTLFVEGHEHLQVGDRVRVRVAVDGIHPLVLRGLVVWRRLCSGPGIRVGVGVGFGSDEASHLSFLRRIALGEVEDEESPP